MGKKGHVARSRRVAITLYCGPTMGSAPLGSLSKNETGVPLCYGPGLGSVPLGGLGKVREKGAQRLGAAL